MSSSETPMETKKAINQSHLMAKNVSREDMIKENGRVGSLFASKAFVQLAANPLVGYATSKRGYHLPFMCGTAILLLASISEF